MNEFTNTDKYECAQREVRQRARVYPRLISTGRMSQEKADRETALMKAIAADYEKLALTERLI